MRIEQFQLLEQYNLWETQSLLKRGKLRVHERVNRVILIGSRGVLGGFTDMSDLDLIFVTDFDASSSEDDIRGALAYTIKNWKSKIELDIKMFLDSKNCLLNCLNVEHFKVNMCNSGQGCALVYDSQTGYRASDRYSVNDLYPVLTIWSRDQSASAIPVREIKAG